MAVRSGIIAAAQARLCVAQNDFSAGFMQAYDAELQRQLGPVLARNYRLMRLLGTRPWLLNLGARLAQLPGLGRRLQRLLG
jgi:hypothetical protein